MARPDHSRRFWRGGIMLLGTLTLAGTLATVLWAQTPGAPGEAPAAEGTRLLRPPTRPAEVPAPVQPEGPGATPVAPPVAMPATPSAAVPGAPYVTPHEGPTLVPPPPPGARTPYPMPPELVGVDLNKQSAEEALAKSATCLGCHENQHDPHYKDTVHLGCVDCHGANPDVLKHGCQPRPQGVRGCPAAPPTRNPAIWRTSANPIRSHTLLNHEDPDFIRFVNPGDLRVSHISCGTTNCHPKIVLQNRKGMMTHGCMLWGAALYNNGSVPYKRSRHGEFYSMNGTSLRAQTYPPPTEFEAKRGVVPFLDPLYRYEISQAGNVLRIFERGGQFLNVIAEPVEPFPNLRGEDPGRPFLTRLSLRGLGTINRTDPVPVSLEKTRLFNPTNNFLGTCDNPGDYRSSGCTGCHVVYANDRNPIHSGPWAKYGNMGTASALPEDDPDPTIPKDEPGHPVRHRFVPGSAIPTSQCMTCHVHPGTTVMNSYLGYMWYDEESDGEFMYPKEPKHLTAEQFIQAQMKNPDEIAARGNWTDPQFLNNIVDLNPQLKHDYFADFHSHGWVFRAVFKRDRKGRLIDYNGQVVEHAEGPEYHKGVMMPLKVMEQYRNGADQKKPLKQRQQEEAHMRAGIPMHLIDIHAEKGMHCVDCHFTQDNHGNTRLQMEVRAAIEVQCVDCHGTYNQYARLRTSGVAAYTSNPDAPRPEMANYGRDLTAMRTAWGKPRFERRGNKVIQNSMVHKDISWEVVQTKDTIDPKSEHYNARSAIAKTVRWDGDKLVWGQVPANAAHDDSGCAHSSKDMTCQSCHSSWNPSCYGCHLPQKANMKMPYLDFEGDVTRNYTSYSFQTLRNDVFMLARDGTATSNRINPARSSCAIHVSSYNGNREAIYYQQQTISGEGFSGIAFSTNVPHTVGGKGTTKMCTDCHVSEKNDNNAIVAQLLMHGTGYMNFIGRYAWVGAGEHGLFAVDVTERDEPQAVIGSYLHHLAFPHHYEEHVHHNCILEHAHEHPGRDISEAFLKPHLKPDIRSLLARGEYLYAACGEAGLRVFDISFTDDKGFSERIFTAPVSPLGQRFFVRTKCALAVGGPATQAPDPTRTHYAENEEGRVAAYYAYLYVCDKYEGLIMVGAATLLDGNPANNFLHRDVTFNPNGILNGANNIWFVGSLAYITCDKGLVIVDVADPTKPCVKAVVDHTLLKHPHAVTAQFRYCFVADEEGLKVFDITDPLKPKGISKLEMKDIHNLYVARTYLYLAAGHHGLVIVDIENPANPKVEQIYTADGCINDLHDVKLGVTYNSEFAYLADGKNGMRIVQLTSPETPGNDGFSPRPTPKLIATYPIPKHGHAYAVSRGVDRDRAVDESGNQTAVFGRVGARPLNLAEQQKMFLHNKKLWTVSDDPEWRNYFKLLPPGK